MNKSANCFAGTRGLFITGTDTDIGKTWFTARLCRALRARKIKAGAWKPVQSGCSLGDPDADSYQLKTVGGIDEPESEICSEAFKAPLAPLISARLEGKAIDFSNLLHKGCLLLPNYEIILVEGAGGLAVPLTQDKLVVDLAVELGYPLLIVARPGLGTVNHTLLTVHYARQHGLTPIGIILNGYEKEPTKLKDLTDVRPATNLPDSLSTNPLLIERFCGVPVLGQIPWNGADNGKSTFETYVQLDEIISRLQEENDTGE